MESENCPRCGRATVVDGSFNRFAGQGSLQGGFFVPYESQGAPPHHWVATSGTFHACVSCGHVWSSLDPGVLRKYVQDHGREVAKQQLDEFDHGPNRGLPDTAPAREVAAKVAEIDALARSGRPGIAGRYRELKGVTWDEAIKATRDWRDLTRAEKLALFGWEPKEKAPADDLAEPYF